MATITKSDSGYALSGDLTVDTVSEIFRLTPTFATGPCDLDLAGVSNTDSAGLALLIHWIQSAADHGCQLTPRDAPAQMMSLIRVSGLGGIVPGVGFES